MSLAELIWLLAPPLCWACGEPARGTDPLCRRCRLSLRWLPPEPVVVEPPAAPSAAGGPAGEAGAAGAPGIQAWAPVAYEGPARALVQGLKFGAAAGLAETMAAQIVACAPASLMHGATLVPVPLHPARRRRRGFNQAELLAAAIARRAGLPSSDCLVRRGPPSGQVGRGRAARLAAIEGSIVARAGGRVPERVLLVDDVVTTGATLSACAAALRGAGARRVAAIAYARTPGR